MFPTMAHSVQQVVVDQLYCDGLADMAKAGAEAKQRGESLQQWRKNMLAMKGYGVRNEDNVLFRVLPQAIEEAGEVYKAKRPPVATYIATYKACMKNDYGNLATLDLGG